MDDNLFLDDLNKIEKNRQEKNRSRQSNLRKRHRLSSSSDDSNNKR